MKKSKSNKTTILDVARVAGVSVTTVSRVLNKGRYVKEAKRKLVEDAVKKLQYSPSIYAKTLASDKSKQIGLIFYDPRGDYVSGLLQGALNKCDAEGYHLFVERLHGDNAADKLETFLKQMKLDGIILAPPASDNPGVLSVLSKHQIPTVLIAPKEPFPDTITILINEYQASLEMTQHLIDLGHERIGFIFGDKKHLGTHERYRGFKDALNKNNLPLDPEIVAEGDFHFDTGISAAEQILSNPKPPTAIFASNDNMAAGVITVANKKGLTLPDDLSITGFDDTSFAKMLYPALTTVRQPVIDMAEVAVQRLIQINEAEADDNTSMQNATASIIDQDVITLDYQMILRDSATAPK